MPTDQSQVATEPIRRDALQVRVAGHRFTLPIATVLASLCAGGGVAWRMVASERDDMLARLDAVEHLAAQLDHQREIVNVRLAEIQASNNRIETQLAELRGELLRRGR